jgi:hypothetical protein
MSTYPCLHCGEPLTFTPPKGWLHPDGSLYKQRTVWRCRCHPHTAQPEGFDRCIQAGQPLRPVKVDDHCATPDRSQTMRWRGDA